MNFFPLTDYMDCYHPQVCTQCLRKTRADRFFYSFLYRPLRGTSHSSWKIRSPRSGTGNLCLPSAELRESRRVCCFFDISQSILIPLQDTANVFIGQVQGQVVSSWRYLSYIFDQPCRPVQIYSSRHLNSLVDTAHVWTLWRPYNYYHPL